MAEPTVCVELFLGELLGSGIVILPLSAWLFPSPAGVHFWVDPQAPVFETMAVGDALSSWCLPPESPRSKVRGEEARTSAAEGFAGTTSGLTGGDGSLGLQ